MWYYLISINIIWRKFYEKTLFLLPAIFVIVAGCSVTTTTLKQYPEPTPVVQESKSSSTPQSGAICDKEENCCVKDDDCRYIGFTGQCNTPEYAARVQKEASTRGLKIGEAPPRDNVTCTCENTKCVTHN